MTPRSTARRLVLGGLVAFLLLAPTAQAANSEFFGVIPGSDLDDTDLQAIPATGVKTVRFLIYWPLRQPSAGEFDWRGTDQMIGGLASHGIQGAPMVWGSPSWVGTGGLFRPPVNNASAKQAWKSFLQAAVARYGRGGSYWTNGYRQQFGQDAAPLPIRSWQIWNEPNVSLNHQGRTLEQAGRDYGQLLKISDDAVSSRDSQAKIVTSGIATQQDPTGTAFRFLDSVYSVRGIKDNFDAVAVHPYAPGIDGVRSAIKGIRHVMAKHGDQATPLWITEYGWASTPPDGYCPGPSCAGINVGPTAQAQLLTKATKMVLANRAGWNVQRLYWFDWRDPAPDDPFANTCRRCPAAGLLNHDRTPKPAYDAFVAFTAETIPPSVSISSGPRQASLTNDPTPGFSFASSEPGSTFACRIDSGPLRACGSHYTSPRLSDGSHTVSVKAIDAAGNESSTVSRSFAVATAEVKVSGSTLTVTAAPGAKDNLRIARPSTSTLRVTDLASGSYTGSGVHVAGGCTQSGSNAAQCKATRVTSIRVLAGERGDKLVNATALRSVLNGGIGDDILIGGSVKDTLTGAAGADVLRGMQGSDLLEARDLTSDQAIDCDGSGTRSAADRADLDMLPKDPNSVVKGCETKMRH